MVGESCLWLANSADGCGTCELVREEGLLILLRRPRREEAVAGLSGDEATLLLLTGGAVAGLVGVEMESVEVLLRSLRFGRGGGGLGITIR